MIIFPGGVRQKRNFRRGGGVCFGSQFLENPEGRGGHRKNPFRGGGGVWIFSGTTQYIFYTIHIFCNLVNLGFSIFQIIFVKLPIMCLINYYYYFNAPFPKDVVCLIVANPNK